MSEWVEKASLAGCVKLRSNRWLLGMKGKKYKLFKYEKIFDIQNFSSIFVA